MVFDRNGTFLRSWGEGVFTRPHGAHIGPDDTIYLTDDGDHSVRKFSLDGKLLLTIGTPGRPAPFMSVLPFNRCTHMALSPNGDIFVSRQFELRPVLERSDGDKLDGLRSRSVLVREGLVLRAESPKLTLTARALNTFKERREDDLPAERRVEIKFWLGLRYDRPAIPERFVPLGNQLKAKFLEA